MKKALLIFLLFFLLQACNFPLFQSSSFEDEVATQAAYAFTQTAQQSQYLATSTTATPAAASATVTPTSAMDNPKTLLGSPVWQDTIISGNSFGLGTDVEQISGTDASVWIEDGSFNMYRSSASGGYIWYCAYPNIADFYLEAKFETQNCNGTDEYGLTFRKPDFGDKSGYYFAVTCEGKFNLIRWTNSGSTFLGDWTASDALTKGPDAVNTLGVWAEGNKIKLFINDTFAAEFDDDAGLASGYFGLFSNSKQSAGMLIKMDEISYWNLP
jgi:hypothetical protein